MMSLSSSIVCVIGWRWPSRSGVPGKLMSNAWPAARRADLLEPLAGRGEGGFDRGFDFVESFAGGGLVGRAGRSRALFEPL